MARKSNGTLIIEPKDKLYIMPTYQVESGKDLYEEIQNGLVTKNVLGFQGA